MYNRYIRDDYGRYERVPQFDTLPASSPPPFTPPPSPAPPPPPHRRPEDSVPPPPIYEPLQPPKPKLPDLRFFDQLLDKLHLGDMDSGDLLLLLILFLLFRQEADEEVLIALGLLLIL